MFFLELRPPKEHQTNNAQATLWKGQLKIFSPPFDGLDVQHVSLKNFTLFQATFASIALIDPGIHRSRSASSLAY